MSMMVTMMMMMMLKRRRRRRRRRRMRMTMQKMKQKQKKTVGFWASSMKNRTMSRTRPPAAAAAAAERKQGAKRTPKTTTRKKKKMETTPKKAGRGQPRPKRASGGARSFASAAWRVSEPQQRRRSASAYCAQGGKQGCHGAQRRCWEARLLHSFCRPPAAAAAAATENEKIWQAVCVMKRTMRMLTMAIVRQG